MIRTIVLMIVINILFMATVFAENPAAEKYRAMIRSGNYHIVYHHEYSEKTAKMMEKLPKEEKAPTEYTEIDALNGQTMIWKNRKVDTLDTAMHARSVKELYSDKIEYAHALHKDGKYYSFESNKKAYMMTDDDYKAYQKNGMKMSMGMSNMQRKQMKNVDPLKLMKQTKNRKSSYEKTTALDKIRIALYPMLLLTDPVPMEKINELNARVLKGEPVDMEQYGNIERNNIVFQGSSTETIDGIVYDVDTYAEKGMQGSSGGGLEGPKFKEVTHYSRIYYKDGNIYKITGGLFDNGIIFKEFTSDVPADRLNVPQGCKVYRAGLGDLDSLTGKEVLVEEY